MNFDKLQEQLYNAFIKAAKETGDNYKKLSWFPRNKIEEANYGNESSNK